MLHLSDFVTCRKRYYNESRGFISELWDTVGRGNLDIPYSNTNKQIFSCCHG